MAVASMGALASLWGFCRPRQNSAADFSLPQTKSVLWSWNIFNPWRSKAALRGEICNLDGGAVLANAWRAWIRESLPLHIFLISVSSVTGLFYFSFWAVLFPLSCLCQDYQDLLRRFWLFLSSHWFVRPFYFLKSQFVAQCNANE